MKNFVLISCTEKIPHINTPFKKKIACTDVSKYCPANNNKMLHTKLRFIKSD